MFQKKDTVKVWLSLMLAGVLLCSCGYRLVKDKGIYGGDITSLGVPIFKNKTYEPHVPLFVTEAFTRELVSTGLFKINKEDPDGYLEGMVKTIKIVPSSLSKDGVVVEKKVTIDVDISLFRRNGVFVKRWTLSEPEIYRVDDPSIEDFNKRDAIQRLSARMARKFTAVLLIEY